MAAASFWAPNGARYESPGRSAAEPWVTGRPNPKSPERARYTLRGPSGQTQTTRVPLRMPTGPGYRSAAPFRGGEALDPGFHSAPRSRAG